MSAHSLSDHGFTYVEGVLSGAECGVLASRIEQNGTLSGNTRCLLQYSWCSTLAQRIRSFPSLAKFILADYVAVQCSYFAKTRNCNWLVPLHQDLSIPVAHSVNAPELRGWSEKEKCLFVQPPAHVLEQLLAIRIHLDDCHSGDGPLQVLPGTHLCGILNADAISKAENRTQRVTCFANQGSAWVMAPCLRMHRPSRAQEVNAAYCTFYWAHASYRMVFNGGMLWQCYSCFSAALLNSLFFNLRCHLRLYIWAWVWPLKLRPANASACSHLALPRLQWTLSRWSE